MDLVMQELSLASLLIMRVVISLYYNSGQQRYS